MSEKYYQVPEMLMLIDDPNREACRRLYDANEHLFKTVPGSRHNHQAWAGGYYDHICEAMNVAMRIYPAYNSLRPLPCTLSDLLLCVFLHDVEKPWKYTTEDAGGGPQVRPEMRDKAAQHAFRLAKAREYGIVLTEEHEKGIRFAEGETAETYSPTSRGMTPLAKLVHDCDTASARLWPDEPRPQERGFAGARRVVPSA